MGHTQQTKEGKKRQGARQLPTCYTWMKEKISRELERGENKKHRIVNEAICIWKGVKTFYKGEGGKHPK